MARTIKADLHNHIHTRSRIRPRDFNKAVALTAKRLGLGGMVGMVNFADDRYESFVDTPGIERIDLGNSVYVPEKDVLFIKGQEVPTNQGHLLVLGINKNLHLRGGRDLETTLKEAKENGGIIVVDHPFFNDGLGPFLQSRPDLVTQFDAIEVHNGEAGLWIPGVTKRNANSQAQFWYNRLPGLNLGSPRPGALACSDGHSFYELGSSYSKLKLGYPMNGEELAKELKTAIRQERGLSHLTMRDSKMGALDHIADLAIIVGLEKIGINLDFESRDPYR